MIKCLIDNSEHSDIDSLHKYIRKFHISQKDYYLTYYPRKDKLSNELIDFKSYDQYLSTDFNNKNNLKKWLKLNPEEGKLWSINWLKERAEKKQLKIAPDQIYLRSLCCPTAVYYNSIDNYNDICKSIGLKIRYNYSNKPIFNKLSNDVVIISDTREQKMFKFDNYKTKIEKIDCGDYTLDKPYNNNIYIERKNGGDFISTLTSKQKKDGSEAKNGLERFRAELQRAKTNNSYVVMVIEDDINSMMGFNFLPQYRWTRATPSHIFKNVRDLLIEYSDNFQIVFANNRKQAQDLTIKLFEMGESVKLFDLQYCQERGDFN